MASSMGLLTEFSTSLGEAPGYTVERSTADARTQHVLLTPEGRLQVQKAEAAILAAEQDLLRPFSPGERALLFELLQRVAAQRSR